MTTSTSGPVARAALATLAASALFAAPAAFGQISRHDTARDDYEVGHYEQAFELFAALADEGHCDAARVAQQMVRYGCTLYATEFKVAQQRLERWKRVPPCTPAAAGAHPEPRSP